MPEETLSAEALRLSFEAKGLSAQELVALSGAHTVSLSNLPSSWFASTCTLQLLIPNALESSKAPPTCFKLQHPLSSDDRPQIVSLLKGSVKVVSMCCHGHRGVKALGSS